MTNINAFLLVFLCLNLLKVNAQKSINARVSPYLGRPTIFLNDIAQVPLMYSLTDVPGGRRSWDELPQHNLRQFYEDGVRLFQVDVFLEQLWTDSLHFNLDYARKQVHGVLDACPEAAIFIRLHLDAPKWWTLAHPEENTVYESSTPSPDWDAGLQRFMEADPRNPIRSSLASLRWQKVVQEKLGQFCRKFSETKEGKRVAGIQVAGGVYGEWHYWGFLKYEADFSPAMSTHFQQWLREKYNSDEALQKAWKIPGIIIDSVCVPSIAERSRRSAGNFRLPGLDQKTIDYYRCQHELVADLILTFAKTIKTNWKRPVITGAFYGYFFSCFSRQAAGGHLAIQKVLRSPFIDYLAGPQAYLPQAEKPGETYRSRSLILSMRLHGKLWLDEMDQQPRRVFPYTGGTKDNKEKYEAGIQENVAQLRRNLMFTHSKGMGLWLYDFGLAGVNLSKENEQSPQHGIIGYWDHPAYHKEIRTFLQLSRKTLQQNYNSGADVLLVYDTNTEYYGRSLSEDKDSMDLQLVDYMSLALFQSSVVFDPVHLDDLDLVDLHQYKAIVFANSFVMSASRRKWILEHVCREQRHIFWFYAAGYIDEQSTDVQHLSELTGMEIGVLDSMVSSKVIWDSLIVSSPNDRAWGKNAPLFYVKNPGNMVFGRYRQNGEAAFVKQAKSDHFSYYAAIPILNSQVWKTLFIQAGIHCYEAKNNLFYSGSGILTFHSKSPGKTSIILKNGKILSLELAEKPVTLRFNAETGESLD